MTDGPSGPVSRRPVVRIDTPPAYGRSPEAWLWDAVLVRYARDLSVPAYAEVARAWFAGESDDIGEFAFVCQVLGLSRSGVLRELERGCALGKLDGSQRTDIHHLKLVGRNAGAPRHVCRYGRKSA